MPWLGDARGQAKLHIRHAKPCDKEEAPEKSRGPWLADLARDEADYRRGWWLVVVFDPTRSLDCHTHNSTRAEMAADWRSWKDSRQLDKPYMKEASLRP